jgi:biopolymer transport protein ExbB
MQLKPSLRQAFLSVVLVITAALPAAAQAPAAPASAPAVSLPAAAPAAANPYGLQAVWAQGDAVAKGTLVILVVMSLASWYVLVSKLIAQSRMGGQGKAANQNFWKADTVRQGAESLQKGSPYRFIAESALEATRKHDGLIGQVDLNTWVTQSIERAVATVHSRTQE